MVYVGHLGQSAHDCSVLAWEVATVKEANAFETSGKVPCSVTVGLKFVESGTAELV